MWYDKPPKDDEELRARLSQEPFCYRRRSLDEYCEDLGIDIVSLASERVRSKQQFIWYDLCCGEFCAGNDLVKKLMEECVSDALSLVKIVGIDVEHQNSIIVPPVEFRQQNVVLYTIPEQPNLITCAYGLMYIQNNYGGQTVLYKIDEWYAALETGGVLAFTEHASFLPDWLEHKIGSKNIRVTGRAGRASAFILTKNKSFCGSV